MNIINLSDYRKPQGAEVKQPCPDAARYFCVHCDNDAFKLYETGTIHCVNCGARIRNIRVAE
jgi:hypothetical protein